MRDDRRRFLKAGAALCGWVLAGGWPGRVCGASGGGYFDGALPPVLRIRSGDAVVIETGAHAMDGMVLSERTEEWIRRYKERMARDPRTHFHSGIAGMAGPIHVEGARPGDILQIEILEIIPAPCGFNIRPGPPAGESRVEWYRTDREKYDFGFHARARIPLRPFAETLGVQLPGSGRDGGGTPGNLGCRERVAGTALFVPVRVEGAGVVAGDSRLHRNGGMIGESGPEGTFRNITLRMTVRKDLG